MTFEEALEEISNSIWNGEMRGLEGCLIPNEYAHIDGGPNSYTEASSVIYEKIKATHFSCYWLEKGKKVELEFGRGDGFGASRCIQSLGLKYQIEVKN